MNLEDAILDKVRRLPPAKQEQVLHFADDYSSKLPPKRFYFVTVEKKWTGSRTTVTNLQTSGSLWRVNH